MAHKITYLQITMTTDYRMEELCFRLEAQFSGFAV